MIELVSFIMLVFGVLQIILFFKIWGMTNDVSKIKKLMEERLTKEESGTQERIETMAAPTPAKKEEGTWGKDVTLEERKQVEPLIKTLKENEVILLVNGKIMNYSSENLSELENYKVIYFK